MNVLVTGGGGFLGTYIVKELLARKYSVSNLSRHDYTHLDDLGVKTLKIDLSDKEKMDELDLSGFDAVFHVAAIAGVWGKFERFYKSNYLATTNLYEKCLESNIEYFIYTSTPSVVFGNEDIIAGNEQLAYPDVYLTDYAKTKAMAEQFLLDKSSEKFKIISLRPHLIWGPGDPHLFPRIIARAKEGKLKKIGDGENLVDIIYVENAAIAHIDAFEALVKDNKLSGNSYFIGQERPVRLWEFIDQVLIKSKLAPLEQSLSFRFAYMLGFIFEKLYKLIGIIKPEPPMTRFIALQLAKNHYFSHTKAEKDFNYHPSISIEGGLERCFSFD